ncbi:glycosyltransferase family 4 protein [uncultured Rikenella sp.]|uniref:glycosyltransferase family 4 protein n=1 Tax=uncultured Rikenella sp. TaxID=368003 RepID=UPI0025DD5ADE|nr:glycosyltransferase family 4 protein [uncultured Rikenella sp.]
MKILLIHNRYSRVGGEETVVEFQRQVLERSGHTVLLYERSHDEIRQWRFGRFASLFSALYNRRAVRDVRQIVQRERPDAAIVHNLFPVISAAVLPVLKRGGVRVLMTLHNYRLVCPIGLFYTGGEICERCGTCRGREWNCLFHKCEGSWSGSFGYALRGWWSRRRGYFSANVDRFLALSEFQRTLLSRYTGIPSDRFAVVPNGVDPALMPEPSAEARKAGRRYVAYAGRLSREKGLDLLIEAARRLPDVEFRVAGEAAEGYTLPEIPKNVHLLGKLNRRELADLYTGAKALVLTSLCYEGFGLVVIEAMYYGTPVVVPERGGLPEIVERGDCGAVYTPGSAEALAERLEELLSDPERADELGSRGRQRVAEHYHSAVYTQFLLEQLERP